MRLGLSIPYRNYQSVGAGLGPCRPDHLRRQTYYLAEASQFTRMKRIYHYIWVWVASWLEQVRQGVQQELRQVIPRRYQGQDRSPSRTPTQPLTILP